MRKQTPVVLALFIFSAACVHKQPLSDGIDLPGMDKTVAPGDDFNEYTNGAWFKSHPIPADKSRYGLDAILADETRQRIQSLIQDASKGAAATPEAQKISDFYNSYMDENAIESQGLTPLKPLLDSFAAIADRKALAQ